MFKFKVGDRVVRARHSTNIHNCPIGYQTVVTGLLGEDKPYGIWYTAPDGHRQNSSCPRDWDLVESIESPIRTVTRREVVDGVYGHVEVGTVTNDPLSPRVMVFIGVRGAGGTLLNANELRSAAMVLSQIAEALDDNADKEKE